MISLIIDKDETYLKRGKKLFRPGQALEAYYIVGQDDDYYYCNFFPYVDEPTIKVNKEIVS